MEDTSKNVVTFVSYSQDFERSNQVLRFTVTEPDGTTNEVELVNPKPIENSYQIFGSTKLGANTLNPSDLGEYHVTYTTKDVDYEFWCEDVKHLN